MYDLDFDTDSEIEKDHEGTQDDPAPHLMRCDHVEEGVRCPEYSYGDEMCGEHYKLSNIIESERCHYIIDNGPRCGYRCSSKQNKYMKYCTKHLVFELKKRGMVGSIQFALHP